MPEVTEAARQSHLPPHVRLINEIAVQFPQLSDPEAADAVAAHIRRFWDPRLRRDLQTYLGEDGDDLLPIAREAALLLRPA